MPHECLPGLRLCSAPSLVLLLMGFFRCRPACSKEGMEGLVCGSVPCPTRAGQAWRNHAVALDGLQSLWAARGPDNAAVICL